MTALQKSVIESTGSSLREYLAEAAERQGHVQGCQLGKFWHWQGLVQHTGSSEAAESDGGSASHASR